MYTIFDERFVSIATQAVLSADNVRDMVLEFAFGDQRTATQAKAVPLALAATCHDEDAVTTTTLRRFYDETLEVANHVSELPHLHLVLDDAVEVGYGHAGCKRQLLRQRLVIDPRVKTSRI
jgi:hypothetical protein